MHEFKSSVWEAFLVSSCWLFLAYLLTFKNGVVWLVFAWAHEIRSASKVYRVLSLLCVSACVSTDRQTSKLLLKLKVYVSPLLYWQPSKRGILHKKMLGSWHSLTSIYILSYHSALPMGAQPVNYSSECSIRTFFELHVYSKIPNNWGGGVCICVSVGGCLFGSVCGLIHDFLQNCIFGFWVSVTGGGRACLWMGLRLASNVNLTNQTV